MKLWRTGLADLTGLVLATGLLPAPAPAGAQSPTLAPAKGGPVPVNRPPRQAAKVAAPAAGLLGTASVSPGPPAAHDGPLHRQTTQR